MLSKKFCITFCNGVVYSIIRFVINLKFYDMDVEEETTNTPYMNKIRLKFVLFFYKTDKSPSAVEKQ